MIERKRATAEEARKLWNEGVGSMQTARRMANAPYIEAEKRQVAFVRSRIEQTNENAALLEIIDWLLLQHGVE